MLEELGEAQTGQQNNVRRKLPPGEPLPSEPSGLPSPSTPTGKHSLMPHSQVTAPLHAAGDQPKRPTGAAPSSQHPVDVPRQPSSFPGSFPINHLFSQFSCASCDPRACLNEL